MIWGAPQSTRGECLCLLIDRFQVMNFSHSPKGDGLSLSVKIWDSGNAEAPKSTGTAATGHGLGGCRMEGLGPGKGHVLACNSESLVGNVCSLP